ncbi:MAG: transcription-repair coupling factor [Clostridia bacterium]|nr:transcription-repair coupling factor [Clostridia bacterium]
MNYLLKNMVMSQIYKKIINTKKYPVTISGLVCVAKSILTSALSLNEKDKVLLLTYNEIEAKRLVRDISYFTENVFLFPKREISIYDYDAESNEIEQERISILNKIKTKKSIIVVTTIEAVMQSMISKKSLYENVIKIKNEKELNLEEIKNKLVLLGYKRVDLVENAGEFSVRGNILDVSISSSEGIRIELWGDEIDSIRKFRLSSQRSTEMLKNVEIYPATEKVLEFSVDRICEKIEKRIKDNKEEKAQEILKDIDEIKNGNYTTKIDKYFNDFYENKNTILDYVDGFRILMDEPEKVNQRIEGIKEDNKNLIKELIEKDKTVPDSLYSINNFELGIKEVINLKESDSKQNQFRLREVNVLEDNLKNLELEVKNAIKDNKKVLILAGAKENRDKIAKMFENSLRVPDIDNIDLKNGEIVISEGSISSGFEDRDSNLLVVSNNDFGIAKRLRRKSGNSTFKNGEKIVFADLKVGDLVVHRNYGIGIFTGVKTITADNITKDYIGIKYRNDDSLFVPTNNLDNVRKYIGSEAGVKLNKLGTKEWRETKARVKGNLRTVAKELIELYAKREKSKGFAFSKDTPWQKEFEDKFPYQETEDQLRCIDEVKKDMEFERPMDRLLCGDVGYGKTEVAIRAAFKAVMDGKQVAYLAPTTILADQQYQEFKERMKAYPIEIELLNRFRTQKQQKDTIKKLSEGKVDIVIGTHRMLSKDVKFDSLGLLIIDEEHRFGVKAKEKIKEYKTNVDVLTMTATPIPRTLQMSIVGIRDMSVIYEPPQNRKPIQTYVLEYDKEIIREAITKELERGGQVFYIFNNVSQISSKAIQLEDLIPEAKVGFAHGKMSGEHIEEIMQSFIDKEINVLVCTTILESGIDIPNANTIIVENADRFGLAQLYQIRGRVGRSNRQAYAYITYRKDRVISEDANQRLKAIKEFTEFGSGFKIATRDLQIRGAGSLFGEVQSGHMEQVGYDMYNRLLNEVVKEIQGEEIEETKDVTIDINLSSFIPEKYIEDSSQKIEIYQDIANCKNEEDIQNIIDEIIDRFGDMPVEVQNLIEVARIKNMAMQANVTKIQEKQMGILFMFDKFDNSRIDDLLSKYRNSISFSASGKPYITLRVDSHKKIEEIKEFLTIVK